MVEDCSVYGDCLLLRGRGRDVTGDWPAPRRGWPAYTRSGGVDRVAAVYNRLEHLEEGRAGAAQSAAGRDLADLSGQCLEVAML